MFLLEKCPGAGGRKAFPYSFGIQFRKDFEQVKNCIEILPPLSSTVTERDKATRGEDGVLLRHARKKRQVFSQHRGSPEFFSVAPRGRGPVGEKLRFPPTGPPFPFSTLIHRFSMPRLFNKTSRHRARAQGGGPSSLSRDKVGPLVSNRLRPGEGTRFELLRKTR